MAYSLRLRTKYEHFLLFYFCSLRQMKRTNRMVTSNRNQQHIITNRMFNVFYISFAPFHYKHKNVLNINRLLFFHYTFISFTLKNLDPAQVKFIKYSLHLSNVLSPVDQEFYFNVISSLSLTGYILHFALKQLQFHPALLIAYGARFA